VTPELRALVLTAASMGFIHTITGPDHYLPFVMMSWARKWSAAKTMVITFVCALGHIGSSIVLGFIGVGAEIALEKFAGIEAVRGNWAAWFLIAFGLAYLVWGIRLAYRRHPHQHRHAHLTDATHPHQHPHTHLGEHAHVHDQDSAKTITPWVLFVIFVFGPCEPLIPLMMAPAIREGYRDPALVAGVFGAVTTATMLGAVYLGRLGVDFLPLKKIQRYSHALAGGTILLCGLAIKVLGL